jgi:outer membrane lipoprotein-sorting protein
MTASPLRTRFGRWAVPATALVLVAGISLAGSRLASADSDLAPRTAAELLADLQRARLDHLSGTVVQTADLGLPQLPGMSGASGMGGAGTSDLTAIVSGSHTWKVWYGGENQQRLALVGTLGESDIVRNGSDVWIWSSKAQTATHLVMDPAKAAAAKGAAAAGRTAGHSAGPLMTAGPTGATLPSTPEEAATAALAAIDPSTKAEVGPAVVVAGRTAYELVLTPKDPTTLVSQVRLAVDGERHLPLRVQVFSTKQQVPALEVGFTSIDFSAPEARQFEFTPPPGTTVTEGMPEGLGDKAAGMPSEPGHAAATKAAAPHVLGTGWSRILLAAMPPATDTAPGATTNSTAGQMQAALNALPKVSGPWGSGRVLEGTLFTLVLADDGRVAIGAVAPDALYAALAAPAAG